MNKKLKQYYIQTPSYYRNKASGHYFFCSSECHENFENEKVCKRCHYMGGSNLIKPEGQNFVLCIDYPGDISCYDNFTKTCSFCLNNQNNIDDDEDEDEDIVIWNSHNEIDYNCCTRCFQIYKHIVLKIDEFEHNYNEDDKLCEFCYDSDTMDINKHHVCKKCFEIYKFFVLDVYSN